MTSCWAMYAISISRSVVMRVFMLRGILSRNFRGNVVGRVGDGGAAAALAVLLRDSLSRGVHDLDDPARFRIP